MRVIGYLRVSTADQDYGIEVQRATIQAEADRREWDVTFIADQGETGKNANRPGLERARALLHDGDYEALVVAKLDRLSRSVVDFGNLLREASPWAIVALDLGIDMTTPTGRLVAHIMIAVAEWEGDTISSRTRDALAQAKRNGVHLGARVKMDPAAERRIVRLRRRGLSFARIAADLNARGLKPPSGVKFHPSTVNAVMRRLEAA